MYKRQVKGNAEVANSFRSLGDEIRTGAAADAAPLADAYVDAASEISAAYEQLRPQIRTAFAAAVPDVQALTRGVTGFAREAMPGAVAVVQSSGPVFDALGRLLVQSGRAAGEFFGEVASAAPEAAQGVDHFGRLISIALPAAGEVLTTLTGQWAEHGGQAVDVVGKLTDVVSDLGGGALPVMSEALGIGLDVLEGVLDVIGPISDALGPMIGLWLSVATAMRVVGTVKGVIDGVGTSVSDLRTKFKEAGGENGAGRLATAAGGLMGLLGGPWGIAVTAAGALLGAFGAKSQEAEGSQRSLAAALRESGGQFDASARRALAQSDSYKALADAVSAAGLSQQDYLDAIITGGPTLDALKARLQAQVTAGEQVNTESGELVTSYTGQAEAARTLLRDTDGLRAVVTGAMTDFQQEQEAVGGAAGAMQSALPGTQALEEAMATLRDTTGDTAERADALNTAWQLLFGGGIPLEEAVATWEAGLADLRSDIDGVKKSTKDWQGELFAAGGQIDLTTEAGRALQQHLVEQGQSYRTLAQTVYDTTLQQTGSQQQATVAALDAVAQRRNAFISEMQQMGFNADQARVLADRYLGLPDDVSTLITQPGMDVAIGNAGTLKRQLDSIPRHITVEVQYHQIGGYYYSVDQNGQRFGLPFKAEGGPVEAGHAYVVGEEGPEIVVPRQDGTVIPAGPSAEIMRAARRVGASVAGPAVASSGSSVVKNFYLTVNTTESSVDLQAQFARMERLEMLP